MVNDGGLLDTVLNDFLNAITGSWGPYLQAYLYPLLLALVCLQFGMIAIEATIGRDIPLVLMHVLLGIIRVGIVVAIFQHATDWGDDIVQTYRQIGENIGLVAATPSSVFNEGGQLLTMILQAKAYGHWFMAPIESLEFLVIAGVVFAAWAIVSVFYLGALIEASLLVYAGPLVISVTPLSWTFDLLIVWGRSVLSIAFKVALILMTLGIGMALANNWIGTTDPTSFVLTIQSGITMLVESLIFVYCLMKVPSRLSGLVPGAAVLGFGEALADMAMSGAKGAVNNAVSGGGSSNAGGNSSGSSSGGSSRVVFGQGSSSQGSQATAQQLAQNVQGKLTS